MANSPVWTSNIIGCIDACENNTGCVDISFVATSPLGACYMKSTLNAASYNANVWGARRTSTCPDLNGTTYTGTCGSQYTIQCFLDHDGGDIGEPIQTESFDACIEACDATDGCVDVSWAPELPAGFCYMKSEVGVAINSTVFGALRVSGC
ncbi:hypothetical protein K432DRAFT_321603, partial [Lepidopterella palustris CBS 459.81]